MRLNPKNIKTFKEFFYKTLTESPVNTPPFYSEYSDMEMAKGKYSEIIGDKSSTYRLVDTFYSDTYPVYLYEERDGSDIAVYFVPKDGNFIYGYVAYEETPDGGAIMGGVYNSPMYHGLAQGVYNRYLIPKYRYIMSSGRHSPKGRVFWRNIVSTNLQHNKLVEIWDIETNSPIVKITNTSEIDEFYSDNGDFERYRIKISK